MKPLIYQILIIAFIWVGMVFFVQDMDQMSKMIFYLVTSWLLLLVVLLVKEIIRNRKKSN
ncbi:hypothetical protein H8S33_05030 [Ornithinibacillus sp. BX22]|uniref:Uncharacterized protein n=2 Tax=Ornithinibacillus TaxID=484508 RepID=A0A923L4E2_9BACI|nr:MULTISPECIES: hypothetical protein [Ornithinibacillus]MBC5636190.1 hypothetical protein [Ornithinibacillus hominis]MBS3681030.1 hypothetical protein [Ornithinibacillus massiliensis]